MIRCITAVLILALGATSAFGAFEWGTVPEIGTPLLMKYVNFEGFRDSAGNIDVLPSAEGDTLEGIIRVTQIVDSGGTEYWGQDVAGGQDLVGYFQGYTAQLPLVAPGGPFPQTQNMGNGILNIYDGTGTGTWSADFSADDGGAIGHGTGYDGAVTGASLFLSAVGVGGINPADPSVTLKSTVDATTPLSGDGFGYLDAVGGFAEVWFGPDAMDPLGLGGTAGDQDLRIQSNFDGNPDFGVNPTLWPANSFDPIQGLYVPEPTSFAVWSLVIAGVGLLMRRRAHG